MRHFAPGSDSDPDVQRHGIALAESGEGRRGGLHQTHAGRKARQQAVGDHDEVFVGGGRSDRDQFRVMQDAHRHRPDQRVVSSRDEPELKVRVARRHVFGDEPLYALGDERFAFGVGRRGNGPHERHLRVSHIRSLPLVLVLGDEEVGEKLQELLGPPRCQVTVVQHQPPAVYHAHLHHIAQVVVELG